MSLNWNNILKDKVTVAIVGHIRPDGDCTSSCLGLYNYIKDNFPHVEVDVYLDYVLPIFEFFKRSNEVLTETKKEISYDLFIGLDCADIDRYGVGSVYFETAKHSICIDHHISNQGFAKENYIDPTASATAELLYTTLEEDKVNKEIAECLYTGIVHDTGVFKYSNVTGKTMNIAGKLIDKGIDFSTIISKTFFEKNYHQKQILGRALLESIRFMNGKCIFSFIKASDMEFYGVTAADLDGIVEHLRDIEGVECAIFVYELGVQTYKVSLRSKSIVDVSKIASFYGGGGHIRAAGCTMMGSIHDTINNLSKKIEQQLIASGDLG